MTSRERVLIALNHNKPDRVPIDFGGHRSSGIGAIAYAGLRKHLKLEEKPIRVYDMVQQLAIIDDDVLDLFNVDVVEMGRGFCLEDSDWKEWTLPDGTACQIPYYINVEKKGGDWFVFADDGQELGVQKEGCLYFEQTYFPYMGRNIETDGFDDLEYQMGRTMWTAVPHPGAHFPLDAEGLKKLESGAKALRESTDRAIVGLFGGNIFELPQWLFRIDNFLMYMGMYPDAAKRFVEKLASIHLSNLDKWLSAVGKHIDVICFGDDLGGQNNSLISPAMYRNMLKPYHSKLWKRAKELADVKVLLHCCGSIRSLLPDLIDAGLEAVNPVQVNCKGMDVSELKTEFGADIVFWGGGCDTQIVLPDGDLNRITNHVKQQVEILRPNGGFVFQQVHNVMANVEPASITEMFKAAKT